MTPCGNRLDHGRFTKSSRMNAARKNSSTPKKAAKPADNSNVSDACRLCGINFKISVGDFRGKNKYISTENLFKIPQRAGFP